jgi:hypothetical protein
MFTFIPLFKDLQEILTNHKLAALGDAYANFLYSLAISKKSGEPAGAKVDSRLLAEALRKAGLREYLPSRIDRHKQADAAEALIVYAWLKDLISLEEGIKILERYQDLTEGFCNLLILARKKLNL